jgi:hypothetical protein
LEIRGFEVRVKEKRKRLTKTLNRGLI